MSIQDLDALLMYFYSNREWYLYFTDIKAHTIAEKQFTDIEIQAAIQKLVKDGYIIEEPQPQEVKDGKTQEIKVVRTRYGYLVSYDGIILIDTLPKRFKEKPYEFLLHIEKKKKLKEDIENVPKKYWWIYDPIKILVPLLIGYFIGGQKSNPPDTITVTKTQVVQPMPKNPDSVGVHH